MTKIAYLRASQLNPSLQFGSSVPNSPIKSQQLPSSPIMVPNGVPRPVFFAPGAHPQPFNHHHQVNYQQNAAPRPKPMQMTPTTRFNSNPTVVLTAEQSAPGGRISKPLMEKRRRARINQCLSQLKQIVVDSAGEYTQGNKCKLEKADILELTVSYVKKLHNQLPASGATSESYRTGFSDCIRQVCDFISDCPEQIESSQEQLKSLQSHLSQYMFQLSSGNKNQQEIDPKQSDQSIPLSPPNSSNSSSPIAFSSSYHHSSSSLCTPPSPAPSAESNLSSNSSTSSQLSPNFQSSVQMMSESRKRDFSDEDDEEDEEYEDLLSDEEFQSHYDPSMPMNLSKVARLESDESRGGQTWRPW